MNLQAALGIAIREARLAQGLSQERLAEAANLHRNVVGLIERNVHSVKLGSLIAIAEALRVHTSALLVRAEELASEREPEDLHE